MRILLFILALFLGSAAYGQYSFNDNAVGNITVTSIMSITITNLSGTVTFANANDYSSGQSINNYAQIAIKSNVNWSVSFSAQSANFTPMSSGASNNMPSSILSLRRNGTSTFSTLATSSKSLKTGNRGDAAKSGNTFNVDMKFDPGFGYAGGVYNIGILYTLTQQ